MGQAELTCAVYSLYIKFNYWVRHYCSSSSSTAKVVDKTKKDTPTEADRKSGELFTNQLQNTLTALCEKVFFYKIIKNSMSIKEN